MIVVKNTKELEQKYELRRIPDTEMITVLGGLEGKEKYNKEKYKRRVTYPARQLKQIIAEMKEIEKAIPTDWNEWQKAKYIYETLANNIEYNHNKEEYSTQQSSNLSILLSRKGICAGYSLLYKEMLDRQGIQCDYMRGRAFTSSGQTGMHAWNIVTIGGKSFPVDLTWDSNAKHKGEKELKHFGDNPEFLKNHIADLDEKQYNLVNFTKESINAIPTDNIKLKKEYTHEEKIDIINFAISKTYQKFRQSYDEEGTKIRLYQSIKDYIKDGRITGFTRNDNAREQLIQSIRPEDMIGLLTQNYVIKNMQEDNINYLNSAIKSNVEKYGYERTTFALEKYINCGDEMSFTRQNNARAIIKSLTQKQILDFIIEDTIKREVEKEEETQILKNENINVLKKQYFSADEFAKVDLPREKGLIKRAMAWIKNKTKQMYNHKFNDISKTKNKVREDDYQK